MPITRAPLYMCLALLVFITPGKVMGGKWLNRAKDPQTGQHIPPTNSGELKRQKTLSILPNLSKLHKRTPTGFGEHPQHARFCSRTSICGLKPANDPTQKELRPAKRRKDTPWHYKTKTLSGSIGSMMIELEATTTMPVFKKFTVPIVVAGSVALLAWWAWPRKKLRST